MTKVYKLYCSGGASNDALANLNIAKRGVITAVAFLLVATAATAVGAARIELASIASNQLATNDAQNSIAAAAVDTAYTTSGGQKLSEMLAIAGIGIPVDAGSRLYLHLVITGTITVAANVYVYVNE